MDTRIALFGASILAVATAAQVLTATPEPKPLVLAQLPGLPCPMAVPMEVAVACGWHPFITTDRVTTASDG